MDNLIRLYESTEKAFTSGGLGCLSDATKCIVAEERNGEYELELEYPINGIHYSDIAIRRIILCRPNPYDDPQPFRIYSISKPISGIVTVNAAHVCYDLSNYVCLPFIATTSAEVFQRLNGYASGSETSRIYPPGIIYNASTNPYGFRFTTDMNVSFPPKAQSQKPEPEDERFKVLIPKSIKAVLGDASDCILGRFINSQGHRGEYYYNRFHIYLKDPDGSSPRGATRGFEIRYGKNMTDVEKEENCKEDYTHILPFWKSVQSQDTTIAILGGDGQTAPVVAVPGSAGRTDIKIKIVDLSSEFDKSPTATKLTQYAQDYISENELTGQPSVNITVNFQSVANSSEYSAYSKLEEVRLCDKVKVIYEALGIVDEKKVIRYEYNVLKCAYDEIEIGDPKDELANTISGTSQVTMNTQSVGETVKNGLVETITNAIKLSQTIYYVDTTGTYTEANPPAPPEDWVIDTIQTKGKPNVWTATEPESTDKGNVFTYSQNRLTDDSINLSDFSLGNIATTVRNIVDPNDPTKVHGDNLTDDSVDTPKITDEAITSTKLAADAVQSRTYVAGSDPYYSSEGTLINLAGEGFIRAKNFSIDPNGNVHLRGTVTATAGYLGTEQNGFAIESNALTGTYVRSGDAYAVTLTTDGSLVMRPVPFDVGNSYRSSVLSDGILRLSAYNDNIGTAGRIDVDSAKLGMTFYKYSATTAENLENYAINGQNGTAIGSIEVLNTNNTSIMSTTGTWQLSGDTYISGHTNQTIKEWIESIEAGGIAPATTSTLGGVIIGSGLSVAANGLLTVDTNTIATRSWANSTFAKPSDIKTYTGTDPITISSGNAISINYSTGLTLGDGSALEVDLTANSPIASKTWVGQQGYLTSIPTAAANVKGGIKVDATGGLSVTNEVLKVNLGTGLEFGNSTNVIQVIDYANLAKKSDIKNATLTIQRNGTTVKTFTANASSNVTANITVPTKTSDLTNDSGFITGVAWSAVTSKPFNTVGDGLEVDTNKILKVKAGNGIKIDSDADNGVAVDLSASDIPTLTSAKISDFDSAVDTALGIGSGSTFLRKDGTWATPTNTTYTGEKGITVSSANKIGHTSTYTAKSTQAVYPITIDTYGHIASVGNAVTIPTIPGADRGISIVNSKYGHSNTAIDAVTTQGMYKISFDAYGHIDGYTAIAKNDITGLGIPGSDTNTTYSLAVNGTGTNANKLGLTAGGSGSGTTWVTVPYATSAGSASSVAWANVTGHDAGVDADLGINTSSGDTTKFLNAKGGWAVPYTHPTYTSATAAAVKVGRDATGHVVIGNALTAADVGALSSSTTYVSKITTTAGTHTAISNASGAVSFNVPTKTSHLTNDSGFLTSVSWTGVGSKPFNTIDEQKGLEVTSNALGVKYGTGLTIDSETGELEIDSTVALKTDIKTYTGEKGITVSSSNAVGHTNTYTAKTTQAVYPIKIDTYGHISAVGSAVTIPTIPGADRGISLVSSKYGHSNTAIDAVTTQGMYKISFDAYGHIDGYTATAKTDITGLLGASSSGSTGKFLNQQGGWTTPTNTTYGFSGSLSNHAFTSTLTAGGSGTTSVLTLAAGSNITLTDDTTNKKITIAATVPTALTDLTGTLPISQGGTGNTTAEAASNALLSGLPFWTATPTDNTYLIRRDTGGSATFGQIKFSTIWTYIKSKADSVYSASSHQHYWANVATASSSNSNTDPTFRYGTMSEVRLRESASSTTVKATIVYNATTAAIDFNFA